MPLTVTITKPPTNVSGSLMGLMALQAVSGAFGAYQQGRAQKAIYKANAAIARVNEEMSIRQAEDAIKRGQETEVRYRGNVKKVLGRQRAALAAQGIDISSGSAMDVQTETTNIGELDALTIKNNAMREAFGYKIQGLGFGMQGAQYGMQGNLAMQEARFNATQTLLTGGIKALGYYGG